MTDVRRKAYSSFRQGRPSRNSDASCPRIQQKTRWPKSRRMSWSTSRIGTIRRSPLMSASANSTRKIRKISAGGNATDPWSRRESCRTGECCIAKKVIGMFMRIDRIANGFVGHRPDQLHEAPPVSTTRTASSPDEADVRVFTLAGRIYQCDGARMRIDAKREVANVERRVSMGIFLRRNIT